MAIIILLTLFVGFIFLAQTMMPFALVNRFIEEFNTVGVSSVLRSDNILDIQLSSSEDMMGLTDYQKTSLAAEGIMSIDYNGGTVLVYRNRKKNWTAVAGTGQIDSAGDNLVREISARIAEFSADKLANPFVLSTEEALKDTSFKIPYTTASKTWRGGNSGWYDTLTTLNEQIRDLTRSRFYYTGTHAVSKGLANSSEMLGYRTGLKTKVLNKLGIRTTNQYIQEKMEGTTLSKMLGSNSSIQSSTDMSAAFNAASFLAGLSQISDLACQGLQLIAKAQTLIVGYQSMQQMNLSSGYFEAVQMVQIGDSDNAEAMNEYNNNLVTKDPDTKKTAMEAAGIGGLMTGSEISGKDPSVQSASSQTAMTNLDATQAGNAVSRALMSFAGEIGNIMEKISACHYTSAALNLVSTAISVGAAVLTGGISAVVEVAAGAVISTIIGTAAQLALQPLMNAIMTWIWEDFGESLTKNFATEKLGPDLGNALTAGANRYIGSNGQTGGQTIATTNELLAFKRSQEAVIAEEAEYQRAIRSPLDPTSQYTFVGSMVYSLVPLATSSGIGTTLKTLSSLLTNSATKLLPTASAIAETSLMDDIGECANFSSIEGSGDPYCVGYMVSDTSTIEYTPQEIIDKVVDLEGIKEPDADTKTLNFEIIEDSNLDKYIHYCGQRTSDWGMADAGISEALQEKKSKQWWRKIPIIGSIAGAIADIMSEGDNAGWITGKTCVAGESNSFWQEEGKYYQRFIEDQRLFENNGLISKSSVTVALEKYYDENPLDNSPEGVLARYSGMTKDDVETTIAFINAVAYIANYDPSTRLAFGEEKADAFLFYEETESINDSEIALEPKYIVYNDLRNRAQVV